MDRKTGHETFMKMGTVGGGLGLGAKSLRAVFIFKDTGVMQKFVHSGWQFGGEADASAKAATIKEKATVISDQVKAAIEKVKR